MRGFVLRRTSDQKFVAPAGSLHSYTRALRGARVFDTREEAEGHRCGNEYIVSVSELLGVQLVYA